MSEQLKEKQEKTTFSTTGVFERLTRGINQERYLTLYSLLSLNLVFILIAALEVIDASVTYMGSLILIFVDFIILVILNNISLIHVLVLENIAYVILYFTISETRFNFVANVLNPVFATSFLLMEIIVLHVLINIWFFNVKKNTPLSLELIEKIHWIVFGNVLTASLTLGLIPWLRSASIIYGDLLFFTFTILIASSMFNVAMFKTRDATSWTMISFYWIGMLLVLFSPVSYSPEVVGICTLLIGVFFSVSLLFHEQVYWHMINLAATVLAYVIIQNNLGTLWLAVLTINELFVISTLTVFIINLLLEKNKLANIHGILAFNGILVMIFPMSALLLNREILINKYLLVILIVMNWMIVLLTPRITGYNLNSTDDAILFEKIIFAVGILFTIPVLSSYLGINNTEFSYTLFTYTAGNTTLDFNFTMKTLLLMVSVYPSLVLLYRFLADKNAINKLSEKYEITAESLVAVAFVLAHLFLLMQQGLLESLVIIAWGISGVYFGYKENVQLLDVIMALLIIFTPSIIIPLDAYVLTHEVDFIVGLIMLFIITGITLDKRQMNDSNFATNVILSVAVIVAGMLFSQAVFDDYFTFFTLMLLAITIAINYVIGILGAYKLQRIFALIIYFVLSLVLANILFSLDPLARSIGFIAVGASGLMIFGAFLWAEKRWAVIEKTA